MNNIERGKVKELVCLSPTGALEKVLSFDNISTLDFDGRVLTYISDSGLGYRADKLIEELNVFCTSLGKVNFVSLYSAPLFINIFWDTAKRGKDVDGEYVELDGKRVYSNFGIKRQNGEFYSRHGNGYLNYKIRVTLGTVSLIVDGFYLCYLLFHNKNNMSPFLGVQRVSARSKDIHDTASSMEDMVVTPASSQAHIKSFIATLYEKKLLRSGMLNHLTLAPSMNIELKSFSLSSVFGFSLDEVAASKEEEKVQEEKVSEFSRHAPSLPSRINVTKDKPHSDSPSGGKSQKSKAGKTRNTKPRVATKAFDLSLTNLSRNMFKVEVDNSNPSIPSLGRKVLKYYDSWKFTESILEAYRSFGSIVDARDIYCGLYHLGFSSSNLPTPHQMSFVHMILVYSDLKYSKHESYSAFTKSKIYRDIQKRLGIVVKMRRAQKLSKDMVWEATLLDRVQSNLGEGGLLNDFIKVKNVEA